MLIIEFVLGNSIVAVTAPNIQTMQLHQPAHILQKSAHTAAVFGGQTTVRTVTPAQVLPTSGNPSFQVLNISKDWYTYSNSTTLRYP